MVSEAHVDDVEEKEGKGRKREKGHVEAKSRHTHTRKMLLSKLIIITATNYDPTDCIFLIIDKYKCIF